MPAFRIPETNSGKPLILKGLILVLILGFAIWRSHYGTRLDSYANDEPFHVVAGTYYSATGDYRLNPEHPPLSKLWVGYWNKPHLKLRPLEVLNDKEHERHWLQEIMYLENDAVLSQRQSRRAMYMFHFILGLCLAGLLWRLLGYRWALISLLWIALEPNLGAHQPLVLTDLPLSFCLAITALTAGKFATSWNWKWAVGCGLAAGAALAVKHSALPAIGGMGMLLTGFALYPLFRKRWALAGYRFAGLLCAGLMSLFVLWASYGFRTHSSAGGEDRFNRSLELKIADLNKPVWRNLVGLMDQSGLFPKAYLWGFADTLRAGMEGRGDDEHKFFGEVVLGRAPYLYFPSVLLVKIPLALLAVSLLGLGLLLWWRYQYRSGANPLSREQWIIVLFILVYIGFHLLALASGRTSYGGIRHVMPVALGLGLLAGATGHFRVARFHRYSIGIPLTLLLLGFAMTLGEKRIYEYYNEIVGGTENSYKYFADEGQYLGQRFYEIRDFFEGVNLDSTERIYSWSWLMREEVKASGLEMERSAVADIHDSSNKEGLMKGYFIFEMWLYDPWPNWDPARIQSLTPVKRLGNINLAYGELKDPENWAYSMRDQVMRYLAENQEPDWELVRNRMEEVTAIVQYNSTEYTILGNAYLRMGQRKKAIEAYRKSSENLAEDDPYQRLLNKQIETLQNGTDLESIETLRPAMLE
ncbi:tetratricopeptide repeat protein [Robiginitalea sediminis]|uniref:tetratricopeptide repeat protein n=1 Tax=Robiginitalea sediminis TaxID=1982593 RepID=UPI000B4A72F4|nr:tetratricopeptide repeat protein [Robiginitalea sediminis]